MNTDTLVKHIHVIDYDLQRSITQEQEQSPHKTQHDLTNHAYWVPIPKAQPELDSDSAAIIKRIQDRAAEQTALREKYYATLKDTSVTETKLQRPDVPDFARNSNPPLQKIDVRKNRPIPVSRENGITHWYHPDQAPLATESPKQFKARRTALQGTWRMDPKVPHTEQIEYTAFLQQQKTRESFSNTAPSGYVAPGDSGTSSPKPTGEAQYNKTWSYCHDFETFMQHIGPQPDYFKTYLPTPEGLWKQTSSDGYRAIVDFRIIVGRMSQHSKEHFLLLQSPKLQCFLGKTPTKADAVFAAGRIAYQFLSTGINHLDTDDSIAIYRHRAALLPDVNFHILGRTDLYLPIDFTPGHQRGFLKQPRTEKLSRITLPQYVARFNHQPAKSMPTESFAGINLSSKSDKYETSDRWEGTRDEYLLKQYEEKHGLVPPAPHWYFDVNTSPSELAHRRDQWHRTLVRQMIPFQIAERASGTTLQSKIRALNKSKGYTKYEADPTDKDYRDRIAAFRETHALNCKNEESKLLVSPAGTELIHLSKLKGIARLESLTPRK